MKRRILLEAAALAALSTWLAPARAAGAAASAASADVPRRVATIGAGNLGGAVGALWVRAGIEVMFSSRHPAELAALVERLGPRARAGTIDEAIGFGEAVLLAVPYDAYPELGRTHGEALRGRIVLDAGNANRSRLFEETRRDGIGVTSARYLPGARIVRAFNAANHRLFTDNAGRSAPRMAIPIAGDDAQALAVARSLIEAAGFDVLVVGGLKDSDRFAMGTDGFGHVLAVDELAAKLGVSTPSRPAGAPGAGAAIPSR